jgi:hypothetical protein
MLVEVKFDGVEARPRLSDILPAQYLAQMGQ